MLADSVRCFKHPSGNMSVNDGYLACVISSNIVRICSCTGARFCVFYMSEQYLTPTSRGRISIYLALVRYHIRCCLLQYFLDAKTHVGYCRSARKCLHNVPSPNSIGSPSESGVSAATSAIRTFCVVPLYARPTLNFR